jgi:predicted dehydrogenase
VKYPAAIATSPSALLPPRTPVILPATMTDVCLIGVSGFGRVHYEDLLRAVARGEVRLRAATVINQSEEPAKCQRLRELGCELFTDHRAMLAAHARQTDVCFIPTGIHLHAPMTIDALRAGVNVFVEKPAAAIVQDVRAMQAAERAAGKFVAVGFQDIYCPAVQWMKRLITDGRLGQLRSLRCRGIWPRADSYYTRNNWAGRLRVGDTWVLDAPFHNAFAHHLNLLCHLVGQPLASIQAELYRLRDIESPDTACLRIRTVTGIPLLLVVTHNGDADLDPELTVTGSRGTLRWNLRRSACLDTGEEVACDDVEGLRDRIVRAVSRRVADPGTPVCTLDIAAAEVLCANAAFESSPIHRLPAGTELAPLVKRAHEEEKTFSELGVPWARAGKVIPLAGYDRFPRFGLVGAGTAPYL